MLCASKKSFEMQIFGFLWLSRDSWPAGRKATSEEIANLLLKHLQTVVMQPSPGTRNLTQPRRWRYPDLISTNYKAIKVNRVLDKFSCLIAPCRHTSSLVARTRLRFEFQNRADVIRQFLHILDTRVPWISTMMMRSPTYSLLANFFFHWCSIYFALNWELAKCCQK